MKSFIYFLKDFVNITPKCQGIRICNNNNTRVICEQNRIRFVLYNFRNNVNIKNKKINDQVSNPAEPHVALASIQKNI